MDTLALHRPFRTLYCMLPALSRPLVKHYSCETLQRTEANTWKWWHAGCIASTPVARSPLVNFSSCKCFSNIQEKSEYIRLLETLGVGHLSRSSSWAVVGHRVEIGCGRLSEFWTFTCPSFGSLASHCRVPSLRQNRKPALTIGHWSESYPLPGTTMQRQLWLSFLGTRVIPQQPANLQ